jgi:hypothetical protein
VDETHKPAGILPRHHPGGFFLARMLEGAMPVASPGICRSAPYGRVAPNVGARPKGRAEIGLHFRTLRDIPGEGYRPPSSATRSADAEGRELSAKAEKSPSSPAGDGSENPGRSQRDVSSEGSGRPPFECARSARYAICLLRDLQVALQHPERRAHRARNDKFEWRVTRPLPRTTLRTRPPW